MEQGVKPLFSKAEISKKKPPIATLQPWTGG